jgi:amino acid transporter
MSLAQTAPPKKISLAMAIVVGINAIVGAGIFGVPAKLQITAGPAGLLTYAFVIVAVLFMALSFARVATLYPEGGAFYSYAKIWGGHTWGIIATLSYLIGLIIAMGLLANICGNYMNSYIPQLSATTLSIALLVILTVANLAGAVLSQAAQLVLIVLTYIPLVLITILCCTKADFANLTPFAPHGISGIFNAIPAVIFGFFGFESIPALFTVIKNAEKNVPKAITWTVVFVGITYVLFTGAIILGLPRSLFASASMPLSFVLMSSFPNLTWLVALIDWAIIITIVGTIHSMIWAVSSMLVDACNKTALLKNKLSQKNSLIILGSTMIASFLLFTSIDLLFSLTALFIVFSYALVILPLLLKPKGRCAYQVTIATLGLITAAIIFSCGVYGALLALK